jgi:hypothetical protein
VGDLGRDRDGDGEEVRVLDPVALFVAHPVQERLLQGHATNQGGTVFAVAREQPVVVSERVGAPDLGTLLAGEGRIRPHPPLALEADRPFVEATGQLHVLVHLDQLVVA